jgi:hypothetical protein
MRYRKKPVEVEVVQFTDGTPETLQEIYNFCGGIITDFSDPFKPVIKIETLEGTMNASIGDYIIKGIKGEFYPCKPDIFEKTYELLIE